MRNRARYTRTAMSEPDSSPPPEPSASEDEDEKITLDQIADETGDNKSNDEADETSVKMEECDECEGEDGDWKERGYRKVGGPDIKEDDDMDEDEEVAYPNLHELPEGVLTSIENQILKADKGVYTNNGNACCVPTPWPATHKDGGQLYMLISFHLKPTAAERVSRGGAPSRVAIAGDQTAEVDGVPELNGIRFASCAASSCTRRLGRRSPSSRPWLAAVASTSGSSCWTAPR